MEATSITPETAEKRYKGVTYKDIAKKIEAPSRHEAFVLFENAKKRLNDINNWQLFCGKSPAEFRLTDDMGNLLNSSIPHVGNLIKVRFHAPLYDGSNNYIWYRIQSFISAKNLLKDTEDFGFNAVQINYPGNNLEENKKEGITCTFLVTRSGCTVSAVEAERTKVIFTKEFSFFIKMRDKISGAFSMIHSSNHQWKSLVNGVLHY